MSIICPLSNSSDVTLLENISTAELIGMYNKLLDSDISTEFLGVAEIGLYHCSECDLKFFFPSVAGSALFYDQLQKFDWYYMEDKNEYSFAKQFIKPSDSVLEIGCGKGAFANIISSKNYTGLELNEAAAVAARKSGITVLTQSVEDFALANGNRYDVLCSFQVLEHVTAVHSFINSCVKCLKPGGLLIYSVPSQDSFSVDVHNFFLDMPPHHVTRWSDNSLKKVANYFPLTLDQIWHEPLQPVHRILYAETVFRNALNDIFGISKGAAIDLGMRAKLVSAFSSLLGRLFARGLSRDELLPRGISVTAVYRKT